MLQVGRTYTNSEKGSTYILRTMKAKVEWKNRNETEKEKERRMKQKREIERKRNGIEKKKKEKESVIISSAIRKNFLDLIFAVDANALFPLAFSSDIFTNVF